MLFLSVVSVLFTVTFPAFSTSCEACSIEVFLSTIQKMWRDAGCTVSLFTNLIPLSASFSGSRLLGCTADVLSPHNPSRQVSMRYEEPIDGHTILMKDYIHLAGNWQNLGCYRLIFSTELTQAQFSCNLTNCHACVFENAVQLCWCYQYKHHHWLTEADCQYKWT